MVYNYCAIVPLLTSPKTGHMRHVSYSSELALQCVPRYRLYAVSLQIELELTVELLCCVCNLPRICSISPARLSHCLLSNIAIAEENISYLPQNRVRECHHVIAVSRRYINPSLIKYVRHSTALNFWYSHPKLPC